MKRLVLTAAVLTGVRTATAGVPPICAEFAPVGNMYAPFCRTVGPDEDEWEADVVKMRELGYTCLHGFCEWSRVERREGEFDFRPNDRLLEICARHGMKVIFNVATANAVGYHTPAWLERRFPGVGLVDVDGMSVLKDRTHILPCLDDPDYDRLARRYLTALAKHYAGDVRVSGWVLWGEPEMHKGGKAICYCPHTVAVFQKWLASKYGDVARLNAAWGTDGPVDFPSFDEVRPPSGPIAREGGYASWSDWREFMSRHFADKIREADGIMKANGATQPTVNEMYCHPGGGAMCNDVWKLAGSCDVVGLSLFSKPGFPEAFSLVVANSVAARLGKSTFVIEECGGSRGYGYDRWTPTEEEIRSEALQALGMGARGLMYWCWRPRLSDFEAGTYGMCRADGKPLPRAVAGGTVGSAFERLGKRLVDAAWKPQVAIFHMGRTHFARADGTEDEITKAETGAVRMALDLHVTPLLVNGETVRDGLPSGVKVLVLPFAYVLDPQEAAGVARFVRAGGTAVADINLAFKQSDGTAYRRLPGGGLGEVFGFEKEEIVRYEDPSQLPRDNAYGLRADGFFDILTPTTATVLERFNAHPLRTKNVCGKGLAFGFAWPVFADYERAGGCRALRDLVAGIVESAGVRPFVRLPDQDGDPSVKVVVSRLVRPDGGRILTFVNSSWETVPVRAVVPAASRVERLFGPELKVVANGDDREVSFVLTPKQSLMVEATGGKELE